MSDINAMTSSVDTRPQQGDEDELRRARNAVILIADKAGARGDLIDVLAALGLMDGPVRVKPKRGYKRCAGCGEWHTKQARLCRKCARERDGV